MKPEILQGYRTLIGFVVGTGLVAWCVWLTHLEAVVSKAVAVGSYVALVGAWAGIYGIFVTKNHKSNQEIKK
jgi:hypothetical protein